MTAQERKKVNELALFAALVEAFGAGKFSDGGQCAPSSGNPTPQAFLHSDRMTGFSCLPDGNDVRTLTESWRGVVGRWFLAASCQDISIAGKGA